MSWSKGKKPSLETRQKISETHKGEKCYWYGKHHSEETRRKQSEAQRGAKGNCFGKHLSEETRQKISEANKGEKSYWYGKHHKGYWIGKHHSEETKRKIRNANKDKHPSEETRHKQSKAMRGEKNHCWRGGKSFEPYDPAFNYALKRQILDRDKYTCQNCGICKGLFTKKGDLVIHHIDGDKKNSKVKNLITLCKWCHAKHHGKVRKALL